MSPRSAGRWCSSVHRSSAASLVDMVLKNLDLDHPASQDQPQRQHHQPQDGGNADLAGLRLIEPAPASGPHSDRRISETSWPSDRNRHRLSPAWAGSPPPSPSSHGASRQRGLARVVPAASPAPARAPGTDQAQFLLGPLADHPGEWRRFQGACKPGQCWLPGNILAVLEDSDPGRAWPSSG